jgi:hypothetical protein
MPIFYLWIAINSSEPSIVTIILQNININVVIRVIPQHHIHPPPPKHSNLPPFPTQFAPPYYLAPTTTENAPFFSCLALFPTRKEYPPLHLLELQKTTNCWAVS